MDFGDYIYIILAVVFSIVSAMGKKRKKKKIASPSKARGIFEELFDVKSETVAPVTQPDYYDDAQESDAFDNDDAQKFAPSDNDEWEEDQASDLAEPLSDMQAKLHSLYGHNAKDKRDEKPLQIMKKYHVTKPHSVVSDLRKHSELQKAVIYSEILKTKF
jgi:hypothetical protein